MATDPIHLPIYYVQGPESGSMLFLVRVVGGSAGSEVAFRAVVPNPAGPIELSTTKLTQPNEDVGVERWVEAGYCSEIIVTYWPNGPAGSDFDLRFDVLAAPETGFAATAERQSDGHIYVWEVGYDQGPLGGATHFLMVVSHGTSGASLSVKSKELPDRPLVDIQQITVSQTDFIVGVTADVPANWSTLIRWIYDFQGNTVNPDFSCVLKVVWVAPAVAAVSDEIVRKEQYVQGAQGGQMAFMVVVDNGSPGAEVQFHATTPNPGGAAIRLPPTRVSQSRFTAGVSAHVDAGYESEIVFSYNPNGTPVSDKLTLGMQVFFIPSQEETAHRKGDEALEEDPKLLLNVGLQNPMINNTAQVGVSFETSAPVLNSLVLLIQNPSDQPVLQFENVGELGPDDPLPSLDEPYVGPRLDRLYVYFPYGTTQGTLTDNALAASITLSPAEGNLTWDVVKQSSPSVGTNWILFPKLQAFLRPTESVAFRFTGIKTFNPAPSLTHLRMKKQVTGYEVETDTTTLLSLVDAQPKILTFDLSQDNIPAGTTVNFSWTTWGAKNCTFAGQQGLAASVNAYPVFVLVGNTYRLEAYSASNKSAFDQRTVHVLPVEIKSFTAVPAEGSRLGEPVTLKWESFSAVTMDVQPEVGTVCENAGGCNAGEAVVYPTVRTVYTLTATGGTSTVRATVVVFPLPKGWLKTTSSAPWSTIGKPVLLTWGNELVFLAGGAANIYTSLEGTTWRTVSSSAPWGARTNAAGAVFNGGDGNKMWLTGGQDGTAVSAEIYSSADAKSGWTVVTSTPGWAARANHGCIFFSGKLWVIGGSDGKGGGFNDVWNSTNGKDWTKVTEHAAWSPRWAFGLAAFQSRLWMFGGQIGADAGSVVQEVWSSTDGVTWKKWPTPPWSPRSYSNAQVFGDRLFLFGGSRTAIVAADDLWRMTIKVDSGVESLVWAQQPTLAMGNSAGMGCTMLAGGAWLAGGWSTPGSVPGPNKSVWLYAPVPL